MTSDHHMLWRRSAHRRGSLPRGVGAVDILARQAADGQEANGGLVGAGGTRVVDVMPAVVDADEGGAADQGAAAGRLVPAG